MQVPLHVTDNRHYPRFLMLCILCQVFGKIPSRYGYTLRHIWCKKQWRWITITFLRWIYLQCPPRSWHHEGWKLKYRGVHPKCIFNEAAIYWTALCITWGREKKTNDYLVAHDDIAFHPSEKAQKISWKRRIIVESAFSISYLLTEQKMIWRFMFMNNNITDDFTISSIY